MMLSNLKNEGRGAATQATYTYFEIFTDTAIHIVFYGQEECRRFGHPAVASEHILVGFLVVDVGVAYEVFSKEGLLGKEKERSSKRWVRDRILEERGQDLKRPVPSDIPFSDCATQLLKEAYAQSMDFGDPYICSEHMLFALTLGTGLGTKLFNELLLEHNFGLDKLRALVLGSSAAARGKRDFVGEVFRRQAAFVSKSVPGAPFLNANARNLSYEASCGSVDPIVGRTDVVERASQVLARRLKNNPCFVGEPGVGKTAIVEGLAHSVILGEVAGKLEGSIIMSIDTTSLVAGTRYRGDFEERMKMLLAEMRRNSSIILFIDEVHTIISAGGHEGGMDAAQLLKPALARGEFHIMGATTFDEYQRYISADAALERRFQPVEVPEPSQEECFLILQGLRKVYEEYHNVVYKDVALKLAVELSDKFITGRYLPDKAIDLMDEAGARLRLRYKFGALPGERKYKALIIFLKGRMKTARERRNYDKSVAHFRQIEYCYKRVKKWRERDRNEDKKLLSLWVDEPVVTEVIAEWSGLSPKTLSVEDSDTLMGMEEKLNEEVIGQPLATKAVVEAIRRARVGVRDSSKPIGVFMFVGPTGVGKTEVARVVAKEFYGGEDRLVRFDMSEFMERHTVSKLVGAPLGYMGYKEGGQLTEAIKKRPRSLILLDEVEKAHVDVDNIFLQVFDDGRCTDGRGVTVNFTQTLIVMTSNVGATELLETYSNYLVVQKVVGTKAFDGFIANIQISDHWLRDVLRLKEAVAEARKARVSKDIDVENPTEFGNSKVFDEEFGRLRFILNQVAMLKTEPDFRSLFSIVIFLATEHNFQDPSPDIWESESPKLSLKETTSDELELIYLLLVQLIPLEKERRLSSVRINRICTQLAKKGLIKYKRFGQNFAKRVVKNLYKLVGSGRTSKKLLTRVSAHLEKKQLLGDLFSGRRLEWKLRFIMTEKDVTAWYTLNAMIYGNTFEKPLPAILCRNSTTGKYEVSRDYLKGSGLRTFADLIRGYRDELPDGMTLEERSQILKKFGIRSLGELLETSPEELKRRLVEGELVKKGQKDMIGDLRRQVRRVLSLSFKAEWLNRIDDIVIFLPFERAAYEEICRLLLTALNKKMIELFDIELLYDEANLISILCVGSFDPAFGARPLKRFITNCIEDTLTEAYLAFKIARGDRLFISFLSDKFHFLKVKTFVEKVYEPNKEKYGLSAEEEAVLRGVSPSTLTEEAPRPVVRRPRRTCWGLYANWRPSPIVENPRKREKESKKEGKKKPKKEENLKSKFS
jgi:ATP-dependent Clp protease ATP-binding subunit ClpC